MRRARVLRGALPGILAAVLAVGLAGCGSSGGASAPTPAGRTLTVFAASSLKGTFTTLGRQFEQAHPGTRVSFSFAGSADLVGQLQQGAPADVLATADATNMAKATTDHLVARTPVDFATNTLEIAVPPGNPAHVTSFRDLARPGLKVVVCAPAVPCGAAAAKVESATGTTLAPVSEESAVTDVLGKVESGEADAGLVYVTDVAAARDKVQGVRFPEAARAVNHYPIAALAGSTDATLAGQFVDLVTAKEGRAVLAAAGFGAP